MNEQVQAYVIKLLEQIVAGVSATAAFLTQELPLFVQEYLLFYTVWYWGMVFFGVCLFSATTYIAYKLYKVGQRERNCDYDLGALIVALVGYLISVIILATYVYWALMIVFAPKVFLIKSLVNLMR